ncbi:hypothetical protein A2160_01910 [Candidatus Beckwithbacteria bacterium RBG_13_42_9]|uniref:Haloacid dehalogenase n=1 Tax=Candidatus Beckwithbacteria bacterium RBG_13_42_9 TaxID=1797457 RepID=A0A1F5E8F5_9BACT|nr:MAG: hypothetical protein A2160_01910 [Candidatus Beckwithbacteria bacterium RBG_13_42_9]
MDEKPTLDLQKKSILFVDFNGVISYDPFWLSLTKPNHPLHKYYQKIENFLWGTDQQLLQDWMMGKYTSEEIHQIMEAKIGIPAKEILAVLRQDCARLDVSQKILNKLQDLKNTFHRILRTDNMDTFRRWTLPKHPEIEDAFDEIHCSYDLGSLKKDKGGIYYKKVASERGVALENCFLIDDSKSSCQLFESLGGKAFNTQTEQEVLDALDNLICQNFSREC